MYGVCTKGMRATACFVNHHLPIYTKYLVGNYYLNELLKVQGLLGMCQMSCIDTFNATVSPNLETETLTEESRCLCRGSESCCLPCSKALVIAPLIS